MRILLIAPAFYDYHQHIIREFERRGHEVRFFAERPARLIYSPAKKLPRSVRRAIFDCYLRNVLRRISRETFDYILLIRGEIVEQWFLQALRKRLPHARIVMYQWDSYRNNDYRHLLGAVDGAYTFDAKDAAELGIGYLPLFHIASYRLQERTTLPQWDLVFVGSFQEGRYQTLQNIRKHCQQRGLRLHHYLYLSPVDYLKLRLFSSFAPALSDVNLRKINQTTVVNLYRNASAILDIENSQQTGLTMRTFEALATGRLLVTTNPLARELLPELAGRILTVDRQAVHLPVERLQQVPGWIDELMEWSIEAWAGHLLNR